MRVVIGVIASSLVATPVFAQSTQETEALAKQSQNPIANLISLPLQNNTSFGIGPENAVNNTLNIQPVYPFTVGGVNVINRFILPVVYEGEPVAGVGSVFGLGDLSYTAFLSPAKAGAVTWGIGPSFLFPTGTDDRLGSGKWSAGVGAVVLTIAGKWVIGALAQNVWSFAGDDQRSDVNFFLSQYFINYNIENGWYLSSAPIITANWEADSGEQWTVPVGGGAGKIFRMGKTPVDAQIQAFYNVKKPQGGPDWSLRLQFKLLFPK
jgi:hypothetical protein